MEMFYLFIKNNSRKMNTLEKPLAQSSIKHVYFEVKDGKKTKIAEDKLGIIYLGKAVFKNLDRVPISIKLYHIPLEKDVVKEYRDILSTVKELKEKKDIKFSNKKQQNIFLKLNFLKTSTERNIPGEWVFVSSYYHKENFEYKKDLEKINLDFISKKEELVWIIAKCLENRIYPTNQIILEFLNIDTKKNINLDKIIKEKQELSKNRQIEILINKLKWLASEIHKKNKTEIYDKVLYDLCDISIKYLSDRKLKTNIETYKKKIRFDKI
jgi:hypothetical protein